MYSGPNPNRISSLLDAHHAGGYTEFEGGRGVGTSGRREGTRAWPGDSKLWISVVPAGTAEELVVALRDEAQRLPQGERVHVAVLPTEYFF
ncbi:MAG TPA: hypothetical protein VFV33_25180 [Gemmatimonadaceae bacterium]|nr:hypothetical protein [Gemmatimonadaceae bacterium]